MVRGATIGLGVLALAGLAALALLLVGGPEPRQRWGYSAASLAFLLAAQGAPILALISRVGRGLWGIPFRRPAELFALAGLATTPLFALVASQLPPVGERPSIWFGWPGAPLLWDTLALALLAVVGLALVYLGSVPDRRAPGGWRGATRQWRVLQRALVLLGAFYAVLYVFVQLLVSGDLALSLVPGWTSAIVPAYQAVTGLQAGLAATLLVAAGLRRSDRWRDAVEPEAFHAAGKLLLALGMLWFYFWWSELLTYWYGRMPEERFLLELLMFGPYLGPFALAFLGCFALPTALLIWNPLRNSVRGPTIAAAAVLVGTFADRVRLYVAAWSVAHLPPEAARAAEPLHAPPTVLPGLLDLAVVLGLPAGVMLLYLLALDRLGPVARWELAWGERLRVERRFLEAEVEVVARPS